MYIQRKFWVEEAEHKWNILVDYFMNEEKLREWLRFVEKCVSERDGKLVTYAAGMDGSYGVVKALEFYDEKGKIVLKLAKKIPYLSAYQRVEAKNYKLLGLELGPKEGLVTCVKIDDDSGIIMMRFYENTLYSLRNKIGDACVRREIAPSILIQVARGLKAINGVGCRHNDIKPANVFINYDFRTKLVEAVLGDLGSMFKLGFLGSHTNAYIAPGEWCSTHMDLRSDVYSLGQTMSIFLCGCNKRHLRKVCPRVCEDWFVDLIELMMKRMSGERPSIEEVIDVLEKHVDLL